MSSLFIINIVQIFFPFFIGVGFVVFQVDSEQVKKNVLRLSCFIYFLLSGISIFVLMIEDTSSYGPFNVFGRFLFNPQEGLAKYILLSPLGYFLQLKKYNSLKGNFLIDIFFQGIFFTFLSLSFYVEGAFSTYCVLELLAFSSIMLGMINNNLWRKNNLILWGLGTSCLLISLTITSALTKASEGNVQIDISTQAFGEIYFKEMLSFFLLLGILLKSSMIEYRDRNINRYKRMTIYLSIIKLYMPIRFLFEKDIFQMMELNTTTKWIILLFCLGNCFKITRTRFQFEALQLVKLFSGFILLGFTMLGSGGLDILVKYSFCITLLLLFYISSESDERNRPFGLILLLLSVVAIMGIFYLFSGVPFGQSMGGVFLFIAVIILYLMAKYLWNAIAVSVKKIKFNSSLESYFMQNIIVMAIIWILTEFDFKVFYGE